MGGGHADGHHGCKYGFDAKVAIHPSQVLVIRSAFTIATTEIDWAQRVLFAAEAKRGGFAFEGQMVDSPLLHAQRIARRASSHVG